MPDSWKHTIQKLSKFVQYVYVSWKVMKMYINVFTWNTQIKRIQFFVWLGWDYPLLSRMETKTSLEIHHNIQHLMNTQEIYFLLFSIQYEWWNYINMIFHLSFKTISDNWNDIYLKVFKLKWKWDFINDTTKPSTSLILALNFCIEYSSTIRLIIVLTYPGLMF